jgi:glycosyltransferase involved in cell wall biosynthesis
MKIVVISPFQVFPPKSGGQVRIYNLNKEISKKGNSVNQFSLTFRPFFKNRQKINNYSEQKFLLLHFAVIIFPFFILKLNYNFLIILLTKLFKPPREIVEEINKADIVQLEDPFMIAWVNRLNPSIPLVLINHNVQYDLEKDSLKNAFYPKSIKNLITKIIMDNERAAVIKAKKIIVVSEEDKNRLIALYKLDKEKIVAIPNGVNIINKNIYSKETAKKKLMINTSQYVISFIGSRFIPNMKAVQIIEKNLFF